MLLNLICYIQRISWYINCRCLQAGVLYIFIMITNYSEIRLKRNTLRDVNGLQRQSSVPSRCKLVEIWLKLKSTHR